MLIVIIVFVVLGVIITIIVGEATSPSGQTFNAQNCDRCVIDRNWYNGLPRWRRIVHAPWWAARWIVCRSRGCF